MAVKKTTSKVTLSGTTTGSVTEDTLLASSGHLTATDTVKTATFTWSALNAGKGTYGTLSVAADGTWTYALDNSLASVQALAAGQKVTDTVTVQVTDSYGATTTTKVVVTITGTNDVPVIGGVSTGGVAEDGTLVATGKLTATDPDAGATQAWSLPAGGAGAYGSFALSNGSWTYTLDNASAAVQQLAAGQHVTDSVVVQVSDGLGGVAQRTVTVDVVGANDGPTMTAAPGQDQGAVAEDGTLSAQGQLSGSDPDALDTLAWSVQGGGQGAYGSLAVDQTGHWTYVLDNAAAQVQALAAGQTVTDAFAVQVSDGHGGVATKAVTISVAGKDEPVAAVADSAATDQDTPVTVDVLANDLGTGLVLAGASVAAGQGSVSVVNNALVFDPGADFQHLAAGATAQVAVSYAVTGSTGGATGMATITVTGTDDAPVAQAGAAATDTATALMLDVAGTLVTDVDDGDLVSLTSVALGAGQEGAVSIVNGQLVFDPTGGFAWMAPGDVTTVDVTYSVQDAAGLTATSTVTIDVAAPGAPPPPSGAAAFTVVDPAAAGSQAGAIADAVLGTTAGLAYVAGSMQVTAGSSSVAFYDGSLALGIGAGLLITSGTTPGDSNTVGYFGQDNGMAGDPALDAIVNTVFSTVSYDATSISFDVMVTDPTLTGIKFNALFGSDEFPEWVDAFVDIAAVIVNGVNYAYFNNDPMAPLSVIGSNLAANYYRDNTGNLDTPSFGGVAVPGVASTLPIEYDGISNLLTIMAPVVQGLNHITIAIADTGDHVYDSGLFISNLVGTDLPTSGVVLDHPCTAGDDTVAATNASEIIDAQAGNDSVAAGGGDDVVKGGAGNDSIAGGAGADYIDGGDGADEAEYGGASADYQVTKLDNGHYRVEDMRLGAPDGVDEVANVETLVFADGAFAITNWDAPPPPASAGVTILGTADDDVVTALATVAGQPGITDAGDLIDVGDGNDKVHAGAGNDTILGGAGHDELGGGGGDDVLVGGEGYDDLTGGSGADTFVFADADALPGASVDRILDFSRAQGDRIDLSAFGSFSLVDALGGNAMELAQTKQDDGWLIEGDLDGDGTADLAIFVVSALKLAAGDFVM